MSRRRFFASAIGAPFGSLCGGRGTTYASRLIELPLGERERLMAGNWAPGNDDGLWLAS